MRFRALIAALFAVGCTTQPNPTVLDPVSMKPVQVLTPVEAPSQVGRPESIAVPPPPDFAATVKVVKVPENATSIDQLTSVHVDVDLVGSLAGDVTVDWLPPTKTLFDRHVQKINGTRYQPQHAGFDLLVSGTWIESNAISGTWTAVVRLGDRELAAVPFDVPGIAFVPEVNP